MFNRADSFARAVAAIVLIAALSAACAHEAAPIKHAAHAINVPALLAVNGPLDAPPKGVAELKFRDVFKLPAGAKGLEPTDTLRKLDGKRVRIVGFMVRQSPASKGTFLLSPLPVSLGDEDEGLADDLPPATLGIDLDAKARDLAVPFLPGLLQFTGTLHVGMRADPATGRATPAQLTLDVAPARALRDAAQAQAKTSKPHTKI